MKNTLARIAAAFGLMALIGTTAFAAPAPGTMPGMAPGTSAVKSHVRHMKNGKTVVVKGYNRAKPGSKTNMSHVKGYTRTTKAGKIIHVKGYNRAKPGMKTNTMKKP